MCTAISFHATDHYFGRNLDIESSYGEKVVIMPRKYPLIFHSGDILDSHFAMIGMSAIVDNYPLFYDATNEHGLSIAGLNFPGNAFYTNPSNAAKSIAPFELIPWILAQCKTAAETVALLKNVIIADIPYSSSLPLTPLHWIISDDQECYVIEPMKDKLHIHFNEIGVLTNNPPFPFHRDNLTQYMTLSHDIPGNRFAPKIDLMPFSKGMGAFGLPGDLSSPSRFVRAAFIKENTLCDTQDHAVAQFFHILQSVQQPKGCTHSIEGYEFTLYSSCCDTRRSIYYYTTFENTQINAVHMRHADLESSTLSVYPLIRKENINNIN